MSEHDSDNDVALEMFQNGLTREVIGHKNENKNDDIFDIDPDHELENLHKKLHQNIIQRTRINITIYRISSCRKRKRKRRVIES